MNFIKELKAFVFDLDGTVVDSKLDFDAMREDLNYPEGVSILEHLDTLPNQELKNLSHKIIHEHELRGAKSSTIMEGYKELHEYLKGKGFKIGLQTRNSEPVTAITLDKFNLEFDCVLTRDNCAPKPMPDGLIKMQNLWNITPEEMIYIGDFLFDLETAKNANSKSGLYLWPTNEHLISEADITISNYKEFKELIEKKL
jgi:HAD superfamily hydrolase (TIGR01549 family)